MKTAKTFSDSPRHEDIVHRARAIWEERGHPEGHDVEIWLEAERQLGNELHQLRSPAGNNRQRRKHSNAADTIDEDKLEDRLNDFGEPASRSPTSVDLT